ncbi:MAG: NAD-dependent epimerase/dehydratase family protein [Syntrophorhabdaceae bacterium]|nr:NAD-dependent epimerase/dehydratase family protein [Syntrophorhabdaceae bacterium]
MNVLITGANGFLGSTVVRRALDSEIPFCATDLHELPRIPGTTYVRSDILSAPGPLPKGLTSVVHTAGLAHIFDSTQAQNAPFHSVNVTGTVNVLEAAVQAGVEHFVLVSSVSVYGPFTEGIYDEDVVCSPVGPYASSKYEAEQRAQEIAGKAGMALTILRLATLYGENDPGNVGRLVRSLDRGRFIWIGTGTNRKSLLYKGDAARACLMVASRPASGVKVYNVSAPPCTMREIVDGIGAALGKRPFPVVVPAALALFLSGMLSSNLHKTIEKWLSEDIYDTSRFNEAFGFQTMTSLREGLRLEVDCYRRKGAN